MNVYMMSDYTNMMRDYAAVMRMMRVTNELRELVRMILNYGR